MFSFFFGSELKKKKVTTSDLNDQVSTSNLTTSQACKRIGLLGYSVTKM